MNSFLAEKFGLAGKVALVTASSQGLGLAMASALGRAGASVIVNRRHAAKLSPHVSEFQRQGISANAIAADLGNREEVKRLIAESIAWKGQLDILVNNAGIVRLAHLTLKH